MSVDFDLREFFGVRLDGIGQLEQQASAMRRASHVTPGGERLARCCDRRLDVCLLGFRHVGDHRAVERIQSRRRWRRPPHRRTRLDEQFRLQFHFELLRALEDRGYMGPQQFKKSGGHSAATCTSRQDEPGQKLTGYGGNLPLSYISGSSGVVFSHTSSIDRFFEKP